MKFTSLSEAIRFYSGGNNTINNVPPYSSLSAELKIIPQDTQLGPLSPNVLTYGQSVWGIGKIIEISEPQV
jgi:hypothetical protein